MRRFGIVVCSAWLLAAGCSGGEDPDSARTPTTAPSSAPSSEPSSEPTSASPAQTTVAPAIDACLVGRWRQVSGREIVTLEGVRVVTTGWQGRVLDFRPAGIEVVSYDDAKPITAAKASNGAYRVTYKGQATYRVSTRNGVLRFVSVDYSRTRVSWKYGTRGGTYTPGNVPPRAAEYTCSATTHTQRIGDSYQATFTRLP